MPEIESFSFTHRELLALLIRAANVKEGEWQLTANFGFSAGNFGPDDQNMSPGAAILLANMSITKAKPDSPRALVMNANEAKA